MDSSSTHIKNYFLKIRSFQLDCGCDLIPATEEKNIN